LPPPSQAHRPELEQLVARRVDEELQRLLSELVGTVLGQTGKGADTRPLDPVDRRDLLGEVDVHEIVNGPGVAAVWPRPLCAICAERPSEVKRTVCAACRARRRREQRRELRAGSRDADAEGGERVV
jgi:hypothetical protein